jgi:hypothetical protein
MSTTPDHLRQITIEIPVTWTAEQLSPFGRCSTNCAQKSGPVTDANCKICWLKSGDAQPSTTVTRILGRSTSNRLSIQRLNH